MWDIREREVLQGYEFKILLRFDEELYKCLSFKNFDISKSKIVFEFETRFYSYEGNINQKSMYKRVSIFFILLQRIFNLFLLPLLQIKKNPIKK